MNIEVRALPEHSGQPDRLADYLALMRPKTKPEEVSLKASKEMGRMVNRLLGTTGITVLVWSDGMENHKKVPALEPRVYAKMDSSRDDAVLLHCGGASPVIELGCEHATELLLKILENESLRDLRIGFKKMLYHELAHIKIDDHLARAWKSSNGRATGLDMGPDPGMVMMIMFRDEEWSRGAEFESRSGGARAESMAELYCLSRVDGGSKEKAIEAVAAWMAIHNYIDLKTGHPDAKDLKSWAMDAYFGHLGWNDTGAIKNNALGIARHPYIGDGDFAEKAIALAEKLAERIRKELG